MPNQSGGATLRSHLALGLALLIGVPPVSPLAAQQGPPPTRLNIVVLQGEGAVNDISRRVENDPVVRVESENGRPIAGATVLFMLPDIGPSGTFGRSARTLLVRTDSIGRAVARGMRSNEVVGKYQIRVQVSLRGTTANAVINQANAVLPRARRGRGRIIAILAALGAAVAAGAVVVARRADKASESIGVTAGTPTVGGPK